MPAISMKLKQTRRLSGGHTLSACDRPNKVLKPLSYHFKACKQAWILDDFLDLPQVISQPDTADGSGKLAGGVGLRNIHSGQLDQNSELQLESLDSIDPESESTTDPETIFSPIIELSESFSGRRTSGWDAELYDPHARLPQLIDDYHDVCSNTWDYQFLELSNDSNHCTSNLAPSLPLRGIRFSDLINIDSPEYDHINSGLTIDNDSECTIVPFSCNASDNLRDDSHSYELKTVDDSGLYHTIPHLEQYELGAKSDFCPAISREFDCFDPCSFLSNLPGIELDAISLIQPQLSAKETLEGKSVTLVLDLDETLVHSSLEHSEGADFTFSVLINSEECTVYVRKRPYLHEFLEKVAQMFEVVIFTASQSIYAAQLLDNLDPNKKLISRRMYRESCTFNGGHYIKDLTILGIDLAKVAIIDNTPQVFQLQVNNGIPIKSWFDDPADCALSLLLPFLETLANADDVRPLVKKFNNEQ